LLAALVAFILHPLAVQDQPVNVLNQSNSRAERDEPLRIGERRILSWMPVSALTAAALAGLIEPLAAMPYRVSTGYNEGWNALWSDVALRGGVLYPPPQAAIANNYPPGSFYVIGALGRVLGDNIIAGRIVAFASYLAIAWLIFAWLRLAGTARQPAAFGATAFLVALTGYAPGYIAFDDPQLLAHAVMLGGLVLLWRGRFSERAVVLSAMMMVSGGFLKQLLLALPLATTVWIGIHRRERLGAWFLGVAVMASVLFAASWTAFGADFLPDLFAGRNHDLTTALRETASACLHLVPILSLTAVASVAASRLDNVAGRDAARLVAWYAGLAAAVGISASTGVGVNVNAFFDLLIACSLGSAFGLGVLASLGDWWPRAAGWTTVAILATLVACSLPARFSAIAQLPGRARETAEDVRILRDVGRGHAACEEPALCYWARGRFEVDFFNFGQKLATRTVPSSACEKVFGAHSIAILQLKTRAATGTPRLPEVCNQTIRRYFTPIRESSNGEILIRRQWRADARRSR
jgi:hypothetical protein